MGSALKSRHACRSIRKLKAVTIGERISKFFLMGHEQDAFQLAAQVVQFLNHGLSAFLVKTAESLIDYHRFDGPMLFARVLAQAQGQADRDSEPLAAA